MVTVRLSSSSDGAVLARIDLATWTPVVSPATPPPSSEYAFFNARTSPDDVVVAVLDGDVVGYLKLRCPSTLPSQSHVLEIGGLAVDPSRQGVGVGRALVEAAIDRARARGARKMTLRVLGTNDAAQRLYSSCGFRIEGILRDEFHLEDQDVDDVLMAHHLGYAAAR